MVPTHDEAVQILDSMVNNINLKRHMYAVEACLGAYSDELKLTSIEKQKWEVAGLLHDADWEKYPNVHPQKIVEMLTNMDVDSDIVNAIASHGNSSKDHSYNFKKRETLLDKALYSFDELSGFVIACALVRPDKLDSLTSESVIKKLKDKSFAASVNREDIITGAKELGVELQKHIDFTILVLKNIKTVFDF